MAEIKDQGDIETPGGLRWLGVARTLGAIVARRALDFLLPPSCLGCREPVDHPGRLCPACWAGVRFIGDPRCDRCGLPFELAPVGTNTCGACMADPPAWARGRAAVLYDDGSRPLILGFKHGDRLQIAPLFAGWMMSAGADLLSGAEVIVPVPLHPRRLLARRFNQSAVLARALSARSGIPVSDLALLRRKPTPSQGHLTADQRRRNVMGAFAVDPRRAAEIEGRTVLLVDDVRTSGATLSACARVLSRGGAEAVFVLTIARVP